MQSVTRSAFIPRRMLIVAFIGIAVAMVALFPGQTLLMDVAKGTQSDSVSIAYLQLLVRSKPGDDSLRLKLANSLRDASRWQDAQRALQPLLSRPDAIGQEARLAAIELDLLTLAALPSIAADRSSLSDRIAVQATRLAVENLDPVRLSQIINLSESVGLQVVASILHAGSGERLLRTYP